MQSSKNVRGRASWQLSACAAPQKEVHKSMFWSNVRFLVSVKNPHFLKIAHFLGMTPMLRYNFRGFPDIFSPKTGFSRF